MMFHHRVHPDSAGPFKKRRTSLFSCETCPRSTANSASLISSASNISLLSYIDFVSTNACCFEDIAQNKQFAGIQKLLEAVFTSPATSAPVERIFSHSGFFMRPHRARLGDKLLSDLVFCKCNKHMQLCTSSVKYFVNTFWTDRMYDILLLVIQYCILCYTF